jgi:hypothetical protein
MLELEEYCPLKATKKRLGKLREEHRALEVTLRVTAEEIKDCEDYLKNMEED